MLSKNSIPFVVKKETPTMSQHMTHLSKMSTFIYLHHRCSINSFALLFWHSFIVSFHRFHLFASRNNSVTQADYTRSPKSPSIGPPNAPFKPVPPPKPKNYRPPTQSGQMHSGNWENGVSVSEQLFGRLLNTLPFQAGTNNTTVAKWIFLSANTISLPSYKSTKCSTTSESNESSWPTHTKLQSV